MPDDPEAWPRPRSPLAPYQPALVAFLRDHTDRPARWDDRAAFSKGRKPLDEAEAAVNDLFKMIRGYEMAQTNLWAVARERLREDPHTELPEFDALCQTCPTDVDVRFVPSQRNCCGIAK